MHSEIQFNSNIAPAKLPFRKEKYNVGALVAGWGLIEYYKIAENLKKLDVVNVEANLCKEVYNFAITNRNDAMCAHKNDNIGFGICNVSAFYHNCLLQ